MNDLRGPRSPFLEGFADAVARLALGTVEISVLGVGLKLFQRQRRHSAEADVPADPLAALEASAESLRGALLAVETIQKKAQSEQERLKRLAAEATATKRELEGVLKDHALAQDLRSRDQEALRRTLGLADIERAIRRGTRVGFLAGVLASLIAALLYSAGVAGYERLKGGHVGAAAPQEHSKGTAGPRP